MLLPIAHDALWALVALERVSDVYTKEYEQEDGEQDRGRER